MKRKILLLSILVLLAISGQATDHHFAYNPDLTLKKQKSTFKFDPEKVTYGGNFGALFGSLTFVDISPFVGYRFTEEWLVAVGASYIFYRQRYSPTQAYQTHLYGGRLFTQYAILNNVFLHGELEALNFDHYDFLSGTNSRSWFVTPLLGGGFIQPIGNRSSIRVVALFAFNTTNPESPYYGSSPVLFRVGFYF
ncbi:MAG: hypothetical protein ACYC1Q_06980 [Bacteroidia bacterium]